jgi:hypothetical protein
VQVDIRIDEIVLRALEKTPELRFATAAEFRTQVEAAAQPADKPLSGTQSFFQRWCPASWFDKMKSESQKWHLVCECGHATSVWDRGGIRYGASGKPMKLMSCPACGKFTTHRMEWRGEGGTENPRKGSMNALAVNAAVWVTLALLGAAVLALFMRDGVGIAGTIILAVPAVIGILRGNWKRGFAVSAFLFALPLLLFSGYFVYAMNLESGGWHPTPSEAFIVPLSWIGAIFFPLAGVVLWHAGRPSGRKMGYVGLVMMILIFVLVLLLVISGTLLLSYQQMRQTNTPPSPRDEKTSMWQFSRVFDHELKSGEQLDFDGDWRRQLPVWHQVDGRDPVRVTPEESISLAFKTAAQDSMDAFFSEGQFGKFDGMRVSVLPAGSWEIMSASQLMELARSLEFSPNLRVMFKSKLIPSSFPPYAFQTREGGVGLLKVLAVSDAAVKLQYKLAVPKASKKVEASAADGQVPADG